MTSKPTRTATITRRCFVAIALPNEVQQSLARAQTRLKRTGLKAKWVPPENIHLTLAFLGDVLLDRIKRRGLEFEQDMDSAYLRELAEIEVAEPSKAIKRIAKKVNWSEEEEEAIFGHFIKGGDLSALGIAQAVTAAAQQATSVDRQDELETSAMAAAELVGV